MAVAETLPRVLLVDDEPHVLAALTRHLKGRFDVSTARSGLDALKVLEATGPVAVVLTDMRMPGMSGSALQARVRERYPSTTRVILSGQSDLSDAIRAVNEGRIFRFVVKPCPPEVLIQVLTEGVEQHRIQTSEQRLVQETVRGAITALVEILSIVSPEAFGQAVRMRRLVREMGAVASIPTLWEAEMAAMFSRIGLIALPAPVISQVVAGRELSAEDFKMTELVPGIADRLLTRIPRLENVRTMLRFVECNYDGSGNSEEVRRGEEIPWGSRALRIALDFDVLETQGLTVAQAIEALRARHGVYDRGLLDALQKLKSLAGHETLVCQATDLEPGMRLLEHVYDVPGTLVAARGQVLVPETVDRIRNLIEKPGIREPIRVEIDKREDDAPALREDVGSRAA